MKSTDDLIVAACAQVFVNGRRAGTAFLIHGSGLFATAAHVIRGANQGSPPAVELRCGSPRSAPIGAEIVWSGSDGLDVAVLSVSPLVLPPDAVPLRFGTLGVEPDGECLAYGWPLNLEEGVWTSLRPVAHTAERGQAIPVGGPAVRGQSGGPILARQSGLVIGMLIFGQTDMNFEQYVPAESIVLAVTNQLNIELPLVSWRFVDAFGASTSSWAQAAWGLRGTDLFGLAHDRFRGRQHALEEIERRVALADGPRLTIVTGRPGSGKTSVLARTASRLALSGRSGTALSVRRSAGKAIPLLDSQHDLGQVVIVDELEQVGSRDEAENVVGYLLRICRSGTPVILGMRPPGTSDSIPLDLRRVFGEALRSNLVIDLDQQPFFSRDEMVELIGRILSTSTTRSEASALYAEDEELRIRHASTIADRVGTSYLLAVEWAQRLANRPTDSREGLEAYLGDIRGDFDLLIDDLLDGIRSDRRGESRLLLTALAYSRGAGLDEGTWLAIANAIGDGVRTATAAGIDDIRQYAAGFLEGTASTTRLFHAALDENLRDANDDPMVESRIVEALLAERRKRAEWSTAPSYIRSHLAEHALAAGRLQPLLDDLDYVVAADPDILVSCLSLGGGRLRSRDRTLGSVLHLWAYRRRALSHLRKAMILAALEYEQVGSVSSDLEAVGQDRGSSCVQWAKVRRTSNPAVVIYSGVGGITAAEIVHVADDPHRPAGTASSCRAVLGGESGLIEVWIVTDESARRLLTMAHHGTEIRDIIAITTAQDEQLLASIDAAGLLALWESGSSQFGNLRSAWDLTDVLGRACRPKRMTYRVEGDQILLYLATASGLIVLRLNEGVLEFVAEVTGAGLDPGLAIGQIEDKQLVFMATAEHHLCAWDPLTAQLDGNVSRALFQPVSDIAFVPTLRGQGRSIVATILAYEGPRIYMTAAGSLSDPGTELPAYDPPTAVLSSRRDDGSPIVVVGTRRGAIVFYVVTLDGIGEQAQLEAHGEQISRLRAVRDGDRAEGRSAVLSASMDGTAAIWPLELSYHASEESIHKGEVIGVSFVEASAPIPRIVLACSTDRTATALDFDGGSVLARLTCTETATRVVGCKLAGEYPAAAVSSNDGGVQIWDYLSGEQVIGVHQHDGPVYRVVALGLEGGRYLASAGADGEVHVYDGIEPSRTLESFAQGAPVTSLVVGQIGTDEVMVAGDITGRVVVWKPGSSSPHSSLMPFKGFSSAGSGSPYILGSCMLELGQTAVLLLLASDAMAGAFEYTPEGEWKQLWLHELRGDAIQAAHLGRGHVASVHMDSTLRTWSIMQGPEFPDLVLPLAGPGLAVDVVDERTLVVGSARGVAVLSLPVGGGWGSGSRQS